MIKGFPKRPKHGNKPQTVDGIWFQSKKEAEYFKRLKFRQKVGSVLLFHRQVKFDLPGNTSYAVDFMEIWANGEIHYIDVKGRQTKSFIKAKKQVEALYPVEIEIR